MDRWKLPVPEDVKAFVEASKAIEVNNDQVPENKVGSEQRREYKSYR